MAAALTGLATGAALLVGLSFWAAEHFVEEAALERRLLIEFDGLIASGLTPLDLHREGAHLLYYRPRQGGAPLPAALAALPAGEHHGIALDGRRHTVLLRDLGPGDRAALAYHDASEEARERWVALAILASVTLAGLAALWLAGRLARQALLPLDTLVAALGRLDPERRGQRLPPTPPGSELTTITERFNGYLGRLDELVQREQAFAAAASHELRTPLAVVRGAAEVLVAQGQDGPVVQRILRAARAAQRELDALLWLSRGGSARDGSTTGDGEPLALHEQLVALCAEQLDTTRVQWQLGDCRVQAPAGAVAVIVSNLLRNALSASPTPGSVRLHLDADRLVVEDEGPGVPEALLPEVFEPGTRGRDGGTGMGLYIAASLAKRLGWRLELANRGDRPGARATLRFSGDRRPGSVAAVAGV